MREKQILIVSTQSRSARETADVVVLMRRPFHSSLFVCLFSVSPGLRRKEKSPKCVKEGRDEEQGRGRYTDSGVT